MKKTVLEYVQGALSVMDSDNVDSIDDTVESVQVADQLVDTYYEFINRKWPWLERPIRLQAGADPDQPTKLFLLDTVRTLKSVRYNTEAVGDDPNFVTLTYLEPEEFITKRPVRGGTTNFINCDESGFVYRVYTDTRPTYYTSFDDESIVLDAYDSSLNTTVEPSRVSCFGEVIPTFTLEDNFVPDLPAAYVPLMQSLLNKAAMEYYKQQGSQTDNERITRQMGQLRREGSKVKGVTDYYSRKRQYGRK